MTKYQQFEQSGAISSLARDVLLNAFNDLWMIDHIVADFSSELQFEDEDIKLAVSKFIIELLEKELIYIGIWGSDGEVQKIELSIAQIEEMVGMVISKIYICDHFLYLSKKGDEWVRKYWKLMHEISEIPPEV